MEFFGILPQLAWWNFLVFYLSWPGGIFWYFTSVGLVEFFLVFYLPAFHQVSLTTSTPHPTPIHLLFCQPHYFSPLSTWPSDYVLTCLFTRISQVPVSVPMVIWKIKVHKYWILLTSVQPKWDKCAISVWRKFNHKETRG